MARALTEVVFQTRLPHGRLLRILTDAPNGRLVLTPLQQNGGPYPQRLLVTASGIDAKRQDILDALGDLLDGLRVVHEETGVLNIVGDLRESARHALDGTIGEAFHALGRDLIHRPALLRGEWAYMSFVTAQEGPVEEAVHRIATILKERGLAARLIRLEPYRADLHNVGAYDETLTPKQSEILKMALALGLYDTPRRCTLDDLAEIFGISKAAAHNRMKGAERKILARYFE